MCIRVGTDVFQKVFDIHPPGKTTKGAFINFRGYKIFRRERIKLKEKQIFDIRLRTGNFFLAKKFTFHKKKPNPQKTILILPKADIISTKRKILPF